MAFVIPSIFTAVDKFSAPLRSMGNSVSSFASKASAGIARTERLFNKLTPSISDGAKQLLDFAKSAIIAGAVIGGITFGTSSIIEYEKAVASFRTIVSDLSDKDFAKFQKGIDNVAKDTRKSAVEVAQSYEKIAGLNAKFAETPGQIEAVTRAVITLSRASGDELGPSAESLVGIMNQFRLGADQADRTINVLAAGTAVGASSITQTAEAFTAFGGVAAGANVTLEQSVGLIQTLAAASKYGSDAGNDLKAMIVNVQKANLGYVKGQFSINAALDQTQKKLAKMKTEQQRNAFLIDTFGKTGINTAQTLLANRKLYDEFTKGVTGTNAAQIAAGINSNTLAEKLNQLKAAFVNMLTGSDQSKKGLEAVKKAIVFVTDNLDRILEIGAKVIKWFLIFKGVLIAAKIATTAFNAVSNILYFVNMVKYIASTQGLTFAQAAYGVALQSATGSQLALNAAMLANPIGIMIGLLAALALAIYAVYNAYKQLEEQENRRFNQKQALKNEAFEVQDLEKKYLSLGKSKAEAKNMAIAEAKTGLIKEIKENRAAMDSADPAIKQAAMEKFNLLEGKAKALSNPSAAFSMKGPRYANTEELGTYVAPITNSSGPQMQGYDWLNSPSQKQLLNPKEAERKALISEMTKTNNAKVDININDPSGRAEGTSDQKFVTIKTSSTMSLTSTK